MKFTGVLNDELVDRVSMCDVRLRDPARLQAVADTGLMDSPRELAFDRLARMAALVLKAPITIISMIGDQRQFFKADFGLKAPFDVVREVPIDDSICRYTLAGHEIISSDTAKDHLLMNHPTTGPWGITAFMSIPMINADGHVLGSFCAIDNLVHDWTETDIALMRELTSAVMTEIGLRKEIDKLSEERLAREQFVAALSHDLRNPIGVAKMSAEILATEDLDFADRNKIIAMIKENMERADAMIGDLLTVTSLKSGDRMQIKLAPTKLGQIAKSATETISKLNGKDIDLQAFDDVNGFWDESGIRRIFENLIGNGIKYGSPNSKVSVVVKKLNSNVQIEVHNKGNPIPNDMIERIFEPFQRSEEAKNSSHKGWGIGLTLVKALVDAHGGSIAVESNVQHGTTFKVTLPVDSRNSIQALN
jgi:signal transduction histidine kinase